MIDGLVADGRLQRPADGWVAAPSMSDPA
jgi:hypothetical protein